MRDTTIPAIRACRSPLTIPAPFPVSADSLSWSRWADATTRGWAARPKTIAAQPVQALFGRLLASLSGLLSGSGRSRLGLFLGHIPRGFGLLLLSAALSAQTVAVGDDPDDFLGLAFDVLDDALDGFFGSTAAHDFPFTRGLLSVPRGSRLGTPHGADTPGSSCDSDHAARSIRREAYGLIRIWPGDHHPLWVAVPRSSCAGWASAMVSNLRSDPQSRPQSRDRYVDMT